MAAETARQHGGSPQTQGAAAGAAMTRAGGSPEQAVAAAAAVATGGTIDGSGSGSLTPRSAGDRLRQAQDAAAELVKRAEEEVREAVWREEEMSRAEEEARFNDPNNVLRDEISCLREDLEYLTHTIAFAAGGRMMPPPPPPPRALRPRRTPSPSARTASGRMASPGMLPPNVLNSPLGEYVEVLEPTLITVIETATPDLETHFKPNLAHTVAVATPC